MAGASDLIILGRQITKDGLSSSRLARIDRLKKAASYQGEPENRAYSKGQR